MPVIHALSVAQSGDRELLRSFYEATRQPVAEEEARICDVVVRLGGAHYAMVMAEMYRYRALEQVQATGVTLEVAGQLRDIATF